MTRIGSLGLVPLLALAAACGRLETPDLAVGTLQGRVLNAQPGAYVYAFGRPDLKTPVGADGQFSIDEVPVETTAIVAVDGQDPIDGTRHAELVEGIQVSGAELTRLVDLDASGMPLAGTVVAAVQPAGGALAVAPTFTAIGTDRVDAVATAGAAVLEPLPPGSFMVAARMTGFRDSAAPVTVIPAATVPILVPLEVDPSAPAPGCAATGSCRNGLVCNAGDGFCYECLDDSHCGGAPGSCDTVEHRCRTGTITLGSVCDVCTADSECGSPSGSSPACVTDGASRYCTRTCTTSFGCPAGFACASVGGPSVCVPQAGCTAYRETFGSPCFTDDTCARFLVGGVCRNATATVAGYCTAACDPRTLDACTVVIGYACASSGMAQYKCAPLP